MKTRQDRQCLHVLAFFVSVIDIVRMIAPCQEAAGDKNPVRVFNGKCYEFIDNKVPFDTAYVNCRARDSSLVDLVDKETQEYLINTVKTELCLGWKYAYIGSWKDTGGGPWYGPLGNTISYSSWADGQGGCTLPFEFMCIQNKALLNFETNNWEDVVAIDFNHYICQYGIHEKICPYISGDHPNVKEYNGNCYEFKNDEKNQNQVEYDCGSRGGSMVEISDIETEKFLVNTIKTLEDELGWKWTKVYIGAFRVDPLLPWRWRNYKQIEYSDWGTFYCNNTKDCIQRRCAILNLRKKWWENVMCYHSYHYICQYKLPEEKKNSEISNEFAPEPKQKGDIGVDRDGIIYTVIGAIVAAFAGTLVVYQVYYRLGQVAKIRKALLKGRATRRFWDDIMADYYAFTIQDFDNDEERQSCCLNIPPNDFRYIIS